MSVDLPKLKEATVRMERAKAAMLEQSGKVDAMAEEIKVEVAKLNEAIAETTHWTTEVKALMQ